MLRDTLSLVRSRISRIAAFLERPIYLVAVPLTLGLIVNSLLGLTARRVVIMNEPAFPSESTKHLIAALIEPSTTKLLPAAVVVAQLRTRYHDLRSNISNHPVFSALTLGLVFGLAEVLFVKIPANPQADPFAVAACGIPTTLMHGVTGMLVTIPIFAMTGYQSGEHVTIHDRSFGDQLYWILGLTVIGFSTALLFHVWWNTGGNGPIYALTGLDC